MIADAMTKLDGVVDDDARPLVQIFDATTRRVTELGEQWAGRREQFGIASVLPGLQPILGGYRPGSLVLLAGGTGGGKSSAGLQDVLGIAGTYYNGEKIGAVVVSLEMPVEENIDRCLAIESGVPDAVIQTGQFSEDQFEAFRAGVDASSQKPIWFYTSPVDIAEIRAIYRKADRDMREHGAGRRVRLLVVDYVGLVDLDEADRHDIALANLARGLKQLAMQESIVVVALCQYNRSAAARDPWDEPQLSDLKDSSGLEQNANQVIMVHRVETAGAEDYAGLFVRKNRKGAKGVTKCRFNGSSYRFEPASAGDVERWRLAREAGRGRRRGRS
jgi:replicative DNA helicase